MIEGATVLEDILWTSVASNHKSWYQQQENREYSAITPAHTTHREFTELSTVPSVRKIFPGQEIHWEHQASSMVPLENQR